MAEGKNKVLVYPNWKSTFDKLTDEEAGRVIKHFFSYINDEDPDPIDRLTEIVFEPIKQTLKRDLKSWETRAERSRENGSKGGRPPKQENLEEPKETNQVISEPEKPVIVNDIVIGIVNDKKETPKSPKGDLTENEGKFLEWFNLTLEKHKGVKGRFKTLTKIDKGNLKKLKSSYDNFNDWEVAFKQMTLNPWVIENNKCTVDHFLRLDNFMKYLNEGIQTEQPKKFKAPWQ